MNTINVFAPLFFSNNLKKVFNQKMNISDPPKIKLFEGREQLLAIDGERELRLDNKEDKMDYMFFDAKNLKEYYFHPGYKLDLRVILEKYGTPETKVIILKCTKYPECDEFVRSTYKDLITDYCEDDPNIVITRYFSKFLAILT